MLKLLIISICLICSFSIHAVSKKGVEYSFKKLEECVAKIRSLPEARKLFNEIEKEGSIRFSLTDHPLGKQFGAFWDLNSRTVFVHPPFHATEGEMLGSILFEIHNALAHRKLQLLNQLAINNQIRREEYIRATEYVEYENSKKTAALADLGIQKGLFPPDSKLFTFKNFDEHYQRQIIGGHSAWIGGSYDRLTGQSR